MTRSSDAPTPHGVRSVEELVDRLRQLRAWSGMPYRAVHREILRLRAARGIPERPVYNTVYRCFQPDRIRLDVELVVDIAEVLHGDESASAVWRQACRMLGGYGESDVVEVTDQLPADAGEFVGRAAELRTLAAGPGVAVIDGMAGIGKTRLATHAAHRIRADVRLVVDLRGFDPARSPADPAAVLDGFLRCLGVPGDQIGLLDRAQRSRKYRELLAGKRAVVVLDNAASKAQVEPLLARSPTCTTFITSRHALDIDGARQVSLGTFGAAEVLEFLRAQDVPVSAADAREIGELVGYLPLALAIAAARIKASPEWTVADHLDRLRHQRSTMRLDDAVEAAISLSYENLSEDLRRTFLLLAGHIGDDLSVHAAAAMADLDLTAARRQLDQLASDQLLQRRSGGRYGFHDLIRRYAIDRAADELPERARRAAATRLLDNYVFTAAGAMDRYAPYERERRPKLDPPATATLDFADENAATAWLDSEWANLIAIAIYADENGQADRTVLLSVILWPYFDHSTNYQNGLILHERAVRSAGPAESGQILGNIGVTYWRLGEFQRALEYHERALVPARDTGDLAGECRALNNAAMAYIRLGQLSKALDHQLIVLDLTRRLGDRQREATASTNIAVTYDHLGRYADALSHHKHSYAIARELGDRTLETIALGNSATIFTRLGRFDEAFDHYEKALAIDRELGDRSSEQIDLCNMGVTLRRIGRHDEALEHYERSLAMAREFGLRNGEREALANLGYLFLVLGRYDEAHERYAESLAIAQEMGHRIGQSDALAGLAVVRAHLGQHHEAIDLGRQAVVIAEDVDDPYMRAQAHDSLAQAAAIAGDTATAREHWRAALDIYERLGVPEAADVRARLADSEKD